MSVRMLVTAGLTGLALAAPGAALADGGDGEPVAPEPPEGDESVVDGSPDEDRDDAPPEPVEGASCDPDVDVEPVDVDGLLLQCDIDALVWVAFVEEPEKRPDDGDAAEDDGPDVDGRDPGDDPADDEGSPEDDSEESETPENGNEDGTEDGEQPLPEDEEPDKTPEDESPRDECDQDTEGDSEAGATCVCVGDSYAWYYGSWYYDTDTWYFHHDGGYWYFADGSWWKADGDVARHVSDGEGAAVPVASGERDWYLPVTGPALATLVGVATAMTVLGAATWWLSRRRDSAHATSVDS